MGCSERHEQHLIKLPHSACTDEVVELNAADMYPYNRSCYMQWAFVFEHALQEQKLLQAAHSLVQVYPLLAGRAFVGDSAGYVQLCNEGLPLTVAHWEKGCSADFPGAFQMASDNLPLPGFAEAPAYMQPLDLDAIWRGAAPLHALRLTTLGRGGSILASSLPHGIADGSRHAMMLCDLALAYCGKAIPARVHNRSKVYPAVRKALGSLQPLGSTPAKAAAQQEPGQEDVAQQQQQQGADEQQCDASGAGADPFGPQVASREVWLPAGVRQQQAGTGFKLHVLHITAQQLAVLQQHAIQAAQQLLQEERREDADATTLGGMPVKLSTTDVGGALYWLLRSCMEGQPLPGSSAAAPRLYVTLDLAFNGLGPSIIPDGYFGNAVGGFTAQAPVLPQLQQGRPQDGHATCSTGLPSAALRVALGSAARALRRELQRCRAEPQEALLQMAGRAANSSKRRHMQTARGAGPPAYRVPSWRNFPLAAMDFDGTPSLMLGCLQPVFAPFATLLDGPHGRGLLLPMVLTGDVARQEACTQALLQQLLAGD